MNEKESVLLKRDVVGITIPDGIHVCVKKDQIITIYQSLGNNYTILSEDGQMVRIAGEDADAIGKKVIDKEKVFSGSDYESVEKNVWDAMRMVFDPEIPVSIVELGLIYNCQIILIEKEQYKVNITMTLTSAGCGMGPIIQGDVEQVVSKLPYIKEVSVEVVFDPPWSQYMISEVAKLELGMF